MTEALRIAPETLDGLIPKAFRPNHAQIPLHLIDVTDEIGNERGDFIEERVKTIILSQPEIANVVRNEKDSEEDKDGHDLTVTIDGYSPVNTVYIQVKSSRQGIIDYKRKIRDKFFPNDSEQMELVKKWMTKNKIILINGSQIKSDEEILNDSFYPQLERIQQKTL